MILLEHFCFIHQNCCVLLVGTAGVIDKFHCFYVYLPSVCILNLLKDEILSNYKTLCKNYKKTIRMNNMNITWPAVC